MNKTQMNKAVDTANKITVSLDTLAGMLDCGRATATQIGEAAEAKVRIGRRVLYNVTKVQTYLDSIAE